MSAMNDTNLPITGICLVSKPDNVPTGYQCIRKVHGDSTRDADLMTDSIIERKDRFLCITRIFPLAGNKAFVLEDLKLINERDGVPQYYTALLETVDTRSKGTSKRTICVKLVERQAGMKCICDIIFLHRQKRPPQLYTLIGEINGLQMCVKEGTVPPFRALTTQSNLYPNPTGNYPYPPAAAAAPSHLQQNHLLREDTIYGTTKAKKSDEKDILDGIPFALNPTYLDRNQNNPNGNGLSGLDQFRILTTYDVEQNYYYDFRLERSVLDQFSTY